MAIVDRTSYLKSETTQLPIDAVTARQMMPTLFTGFVKFHRTSYQ
jgi:hypothetical protein